MKTVLIDMDPGTDDALALIVALNSPEIDVASVTTVGGNARLADTTRNALQILAYLDSKTSVSAGASKPLHGRFDYAYSFHGPKGLGVRLPRPHTSRIRSLAAEHIVNTASAHRGNLMLIALGPLTNIAIAMRREHKLVRWISDIVVMGGAVGVPGNITPWAEFNIYNDPEAAQEVFASGVPTKLICLDVTMKIALARDEAPWVPGNSKSALLAKSVLGNWFKTHPTSDLYHLHDPLAIAVAVRPNLLEYRSVIANVETQYSNRRGRITTTNHDSPLSIAVDINVERARELIVNRLRARG